MSGRQRRKPIPFPQLPPRGILERMRDSPRIWPEHYNVTITDGRSTSRSTFGRVGMETALSMGEHFGLTVHVEPVGPLPIADLAAYRERKGARQ